MRVVRAGLISYVHGLRLQEEAAREVERGGERVLFLLEHQPVVTFGRHGGEQHLHHPAATLRARGVEVVKSDRGGQVTCHYPGQLVVYVIEKIDRRPGGVRRFVHDLEEAAIRTLKNFGIPAAREPGRPGVWTGGKKIASLGIAVKRWVTRHGLSLNVTDDLEPFTWVTPCGLPGAEVTSIHRELGSPDISMHRVEDEFAQQFAGCATHS